MKEFKRLLILFRPYWGWAIAGIFVSFISVMANIVLLAVSGWFITMMAIAGLTWIAVNYFSPAAIIRACAILRTGGRYVERLITHEATFRFMAEMRLWVYTRIEAMPLAQSSKYHSGDLLTRLRGDIDTLESFYIGVVLPSCVAFMALVAVTITLSLYHPGLAVAELFLLLSAGIFIPFIAFKKGKITSRDITNQKSELKINMVDNLQAMAEMTIYGIADQRMEMTLKKSDALIDQQRKLGLMDGIAQGATGMLANIGLWVALVFALYLYKNQIIDKPSVPMLPLLALASFEAVLPLPLAFQSLEGSLQAARRIFALDEGYKATVENDLAPSSRIDLHMKNISFAYEKTSGTILHDFSMHLQSGQSVLLIGPSGIGKSSILHLLTGLYAPDTGQITLNGQDYTDLEYIRRYFAVVPQRPHIFAGTIRSNLLIAKPDATIAQLDHACRVACFDRYVEIQIKGYDTYLGEGGTTLSGGEIRRLAIARAILKDAPILLLDEPTEGLDRETADQLQANLFEWLGDKAMLYITHEKTDPNLFTKVIVLK